MKRDGVLISALASIDGVPVSSIARLDGVDVPPSSPPPVSCDVDRGGNTGASNGSTQLANASNRNHMASPHTYGSAFSVCAVTLWLEPNGSPTQSIVAAIWSDNSGEPGTLLAESTEVSAALLESGEQARKFALLAPASLSAGVQYWIGLRVIGSANSSHYIRWHRNSTSPSVVKRSGDGSTWVDETTARRGKFGLWSSS